MLLCPNLEHPPFQPGAEHVAANGRGVFCYFVTFWCDRLCTGSRNWPKQCSGVLSTDSWIVAFDGRHSEVSEPRRRPSGSPRPLSSHRPWPSRLCQRAGGYGGHISTRWVLEARLSRMEPLRHSQWCCLVPRWKAPRDRCGARHPTRRSRPASRQRRGPHPAGSRMVRNRQATRQSTWRRVRREVSSWRQSFWSGALP
jgi:hypothetical protein